MYIVYLIIVSSGISIIDMFLSLALMSSDQSANEMLPIDIAILDMDGSGTSRTFELLSSNINRVSAGNPLRHSQSILSLGPMVPISTDFGREVVGVWVVSMRLVEASLDRGRTRAQTR
jgi:hypothetical protein